MIKDKRNLVKNVNEVGSIWNANHDGTRRSDKICGKVVEFKLDKDVVGTKEVYFEEEVNADYKLTKLQVEKIKESIIKSLENFSVPKNFMPEKLTFNEEDGYEVEIYLGDNTTLTLDLENTDVENLINLITYIEDKIQSILLFTLADKYDEYGIENCNLECRKCVYEYECRLNTINEFNKDRQKEIDMQVIEDIFDCNICKEEIYETMQELRKMAKYKNYSALDFLEDKELDFYNSITREYDNAFVDAVAEVLEDFRVEDYLQKLF